MIPYEELKSILENNDKQFCETLAQKARAVTTRYFGRTISLYAPLYLSNYCDNVCVYCGFNRTRAVERKKLSPEEMHREMEKVAQSGIRNILLLTGESRVFTPPDYIKKAVETAKEYFPSISLEVYPLETDEYRELCAAGADGITIYQETYHQDRYQELHRAGKKTDYRYRLETPARIAASGIRMITMGVLLGLSEISADAFQLFLHLEQMEKKYPGVEYALSFPRLVPLKEKGTDYYPVSDLVLIKLICIARLLFPRVGINLSTREKPCIRDHALLLGVTRISAASRTTVGGYSREEIKDPQFEVMDTRPVAEIVAVLAQKGFDPVFTDWRRISNTMKLL
jgi:2-iminoacetate synthase